ncbi:CIC11C00000004544 [Sungouiella intermedia]|uniref:CIC11C00000004544 n=1 Tax=Sungouiella intermedia TaxID=45354 RepID=A0A1L0DIB7_9ASCO|nr:CIC11C00000004544 [[Candida] intermedia]
MLALRRNSSLYALCRMANNLSLRKKSTSVSEKLTMAQAQMEFMTHEKNPSQGSLPFEMRRHSESFGQLVRSEHWKKKGDLNDSEYVKTIELHPESQMELLPSPFRNADGSFIQGNTSEEARLHPLTLEARVDHTTVKLPDEIAKVINKNILLVVSPDKLRERSALVYQSLEKEQIQKAPDLSLEADAHIASLFLQNYSHAKRVLSELKKRVGDSFNPQSILDVGYGPATGMIALNEIMGENFRPTTKEVYVVGRSNAEMKKRAKILLSRQVCEIPDEHELTKAAQEVVEEVIEDQEAEEGEKLDISEGYTNFEEKEYIGPVDASQIKIRTRLRDALPSTKQYELIIVNQALLTREYSFPNDVDTNIHMLLRLLKPNGHLVLIERGNALGFEIVARARQIMLRPESFESEKGVVAPCSHHARCPLQLGDPNLYKVSNHKHRLNFCSFNQVVERPKYTMELKRGRRLATQWDKGAHDGMGIDNLSKKTLKNLEGSGRPGGNNTESGNFSYLIMHRSPNDASTIAKIESDRAHHADVSQQAVRWPRILEFPAKIKNNVKLNVCAPSGNIEVWQVPKSLGKQTYHDARKMRQGDLWALDKKSVIVKNRLSPANFDKLNRLASTQRKFIMKEKRKKQWKKIVSRSESDFEENPIELADELASDLESSKKYRTEGKRAKFDVNPRTYDGN